MCVSVCQWRRVRVSVYQQCQCDMVCHVLPLFNFLWFKPLLNIPIIAKCRLFRLCGVSKVFGVAAAAIRLTCRHADQCTERLYFSQLEVRA